MPSRASPRLAMPDWEREAQRRLKNTKFPSAGREEVARELAGYLDDACERAEGEGLSESAALRSASAELHEDPRLGAHLYHARQEGNMNDRTKQLWLPGITMLFASAVLEVLIQFVSFHFSHHVVLHENGGTMSMYVLMGQNPMMLACFAWLCLLPFIGAAGAYWSRRACAGRAFQAAAGLFPALLCFAVFVGEEVARAEGTMEVHLAFYLFGPSNAPGPFSWSRIEHSLSWSVVFPCAALLLGVLPFLLRPAKRSHEVNSPVAAQ
jgi:hypothetical protein